MKRATISQTKNQLSALLEHVKRGEEVLILERDVPIARIVPVHGVGPRDAGSMLAELERRGVVRTSRKPADAKLTARLGPPPVARGDILAALLADREEAR
jgi:antitoxin (DNA-binding transcriptional repressor) of toxin-antitoxin stability system